MMRFYLAVLVLTFLTASLAQKDIPFQEDNEFAEFEDFEEESKKASEPEIQEQEETPDIKKPVEAENEEATVENEDDDFEHFQDDEEFEGYDKGKGFKGKEKVPDLQIITKVPDLWRNNWDSFYLEILMMAGLGVYFLNFLAGKAKNQRIAQAWLNSHKDLLEANFSIVGDDGTTTEVQSGVLMKESENIYSLWCTGRQACEGMFVEIKLLKRQDLVNTIARIFRPMNDQLTVKITIDEGEMDSFVFALATKKTAAKLQKEMNDINNYCPERKSAEKFGLSQNYQILSEIGEVTPAVLDSKICAVINKFEGALEYIHLSDQFSGQKSTEEETPTKLPETKKSLQFCFNISKKGNCNPRDIGHFRPLLQMVFYTLDKVKRIRLSKEAKGKADRNRQKVEESYLKATHSQRQEAAQQRREDKKRAEKERMMNEDDPDKQRKWEERESRREMKRRQPKVKLMKSKM